MAVKKTKSLPSEPLVEGETRQKKTDVRSTEENEAGGARL